MSWERELKRLDDQLAEGRIDRAEYRRLRDDLLAEVSAVPPVARRPEPPAEEPKPEPAAEEPRQPPLRWEATNPGTLPPPPALMPEAPVGTTRLAPPSVPAGAVNGPAVFAAARPGGRRAGVIALVVVTVLVVVIGAGAIWLFGLRPGAHQRTGGRPVPVPVPVDTRTLAAIAAALPALPGTEKPGTGIVDPAAGVRLGLYSQALADTMTSHGVHTVLLRFTSRSSTVPAVTVDNDALLVIPAQDATQADRNTAALADYERSVGWAPVPNPGLPPSVRTMTIVVANQTVRTALFRSGNYTVWLAVGHVPAGDQTTLSADFQSVASSVVAAIRPS